MCNYSNTHYTQCGCTVSEQTERCGYHDDDFSACMKYTDIKDLEPRNGRCGRGGCRHPEPASSMKEWMIQDIDVSRPMIELEGIDVGQARVA